MSKPFNLTDSHLGYFQNLTDWVVTGVNGEVLNIANGTNVITLEGNKTLKVKVGDLLKFDKEAKTLALAQTTTKTKQKHNPGPEAFERMGRG